MNEQLTNKEFYRLLRDQESPVHWHLGEGDTPVSRVLIEQNGQLVEIAGIVHNNWSEPYSENMYYKVT